MRNFAALFAMGLIMAVLSACAPATSIPVNFDLNGTPVVPTGITVHLDEVAAASAAAPAAAPAAVPAPASVLTAADWGAMEVFTVSPVDGSFTIQSGQLAAFWWVPTVDGVPFSNYSGFWLGAGTYGLKGPGRIRIWDTTGVIDLPGFRTWWQTVVQTEAGAAGTYVWTSK